ncbi:hypothetical protein [Seonamhaeicola marinus]|uniref:HEPN AbiU2-like domain-containing protein n=1 Tax=Seonamhaeicola marinus TaxID=1912246 RepID=A0A5D0J9Z8_9FLAO|nr:hypothetical protein [Seonamhaeicola marinus]TYA92331.1 hypothetical protein FUA24_02535 [Seonamhaeicola marinus]
MKIQPEINKTISKIPENIILDYAFYKEMESRNNFRYKSSTEIGLYCSIIQSDLILGSGGLSKAKTELEEKFYARILSLTLYEYLKDLSRILGKELVNELKKNKYEDLIDSVYSLNKEFSDLKKEKENVIKKIRHETIAHKTGNRISLVEQLFSIDCGEIGFLSIDIINLNTKLIRILTQIKNRIAEYHSKNGQMKNKNN